MDDLISRKALMDAINRDPRGQAIAAMRSGKVLQALTIVLEHIRTAPAVDAVEVVRCRDCKHCSQNTPDGLHWCEENEIGALMDDDFCSCGERRSDDAID